MLPNCKRVVNISGRLRFHQGCARDVFVKNQWYRFIYLVFQRKRFFGS